MTTLRRHALDIAAFLWGLAEATLFFFVPDVILSYIGVKHGVKATVRASLIAAIGAAIGGAFMYLWAAADYAAARDVVLAVPAISAEMAARARDAMTSQGWFVASLLGPLSSTPYKVFAIFAPQAGAPLPLFMLASVIARLPRFLAVGSGVALIGRWLEPRIGAKRVIWVLAGAWIVFYAVFFALVPS
jgi:membrane protein YqaA with SNARE-associated domain